MTNQQPSTNKYKHRINDSKMLFSALLFTLVTINLSACQQGNHSDSSDVDKTDQANVLIKLTTKVRFNNVTEEIGLTSLPAWKYGGPSVADINNDGRYDLVLTNHDTTPIQLFLSKAENQFVEQTAPFPIADAHGLALGDYDLDGDNDLLLSLGGGNGTKPQPQRLLRNDGGSFTDVTVEAGLGEMGARGRSVRWVDIDLDGDLDFMQINAEQMMGETIPRNILFENTGNGQFQYRSSPAFEHIDAERLIITDINSDHQADIIAFSPYSPMSIWKGNTDFKFTNVTEQYLTQEYLAQHGNITDVTSMAQADIDNDGDMDYYLARGKVYYQIANNAVSFDPVKQRLDLRDEGNKSHDGISFSANGPIQLSDFYHFPRGPKKIIIPLFIGAEKQLITNKETQITRDSALGFPEIIEQSGWYLGYIGNDEWRLEWLLQDNLAWDIRASITGVSAIEPDWTPQELGVDDILFRNDGNKLTDVSHLLPKQSQNNNWGVITADFNNDTHNDFFVYRFGELTERINDVMLLNSDKLNQQGFISHETHQATTLGVNAHGDMGSAFDNNLDGFVDILSGDDDNGKWYLYQNKLGSELNFNQHSDHKNNQHQYLLAHIGYSESGIDPHGAEVTVETATQIQFKLIGSSSASHSQSLKNISHFGLGESDVIEKIHVRWRDGTQQTRINLAANQLIKIGK
ncbi:CRTAC1 family protein [Shewanella sp. 1_MG-2023]|uniref:CRTAC1 family protein n=1 Tax=unclassified Shewanella TaxID=196818 RepID=UPI0026E3FE17|nr:MULTISPECIES: CRTAC1 family protein [unclassified Shewanella]MDO6612300.1 CRTAC1 family protein [Shewanella sp. 7_MG-2023]MDO6772154.1 CRTAC1 family protein [Shewanella sp. 2_MG-2023]MDO6794060.1 CRTAC1 family protein [Shewanella sp. 1_MG-2023]